MICFIWVSPLGCGFTRSLFPLSTIFLISSHFSVDRFSDVVGPVVADFADEILESIDADGAALPRAASAAAISGPSLVVIEPDPSESSRRIVVLALEFDRMGFNGFPPYA
jgi:hypothetical protein